MSHPVTSIITTGDAVANEETRLSICLRADGFSFSVATLDGILLTVGDCRPDGWKLDATAARRVADTVTDARDLALGYRQMQLIIPTTQFTWVPEHLFDASRVHQYLHFVAELDEGANAYHIYSPAIKAYMVFAAPDALVTPFKVALPGIDVHNQHSAMVTEHLLQASAGHPVILMHVRDGVADIEAMYNGQLLLSNSYDANGEEELLYHALNVMKRLHLETPDMDLKICGNVDRSIYARLSRFFPNVTLYTGIPHRYLNPEFETLHTYRHALILS